MQAKFRQFQQLKINLFATASVKQVEYFEKNWLTIGKQKTVTLAPPNIFIDDSAELVQSQGKGAPKSTNKKSKTISNHFTAPAVVKLTRAVAKKRKENEPVEIEKPAKKAFIPSHLIHPFFSNIITDMDLVTKKQKITEKNLNYDY